MHKRNCSCNIKDVLCNLEKELCSLFRSKKLCCDRREKEKKCKQVECSCECDCYIPSQKDNCK